MMTCSVCRHSQRSEIDAELLAGGPLRPMADRYRLSKTSLIRHRTNCISVQLAKAKEISEVATASSLVKELRELTKKTGAILARAVREKHADIALKAIARLERQLELKGRLLGELEEREPKSTTINVVYVDAGKKLPHVQTVELSPGTHDSPHSFDGRKSNDKKTFDVTTCDPLLIPQSRDSEETDCGENVSNAPRRTGAAGRP
jgi:hypothetical protein